MWCVLCAEVTSIAHCWPTSHNKLVDPTELVAMMKAVEQAPELSHILAANITGSYEIPGA